MSRESIENIVENIVGEIITGSNLELVDVEFVKERDWYLRVYLDKPNGIELEDCQMVSEQLEERLDTLDPISYSYYLEVSSPGLDRPLKKAKDFERHMGDKVEVHTFIPLDGKKLLVGTLSGYKDNIVNIQMEEEELAIPQEKISQVRLYIEF